MACEEFNFSVSNSCTHATEGMEFSKSFRRYTQSTGIDIDITGRSYDMVIKVRLGSATLLTLSNVLNQTDTGFYLNDPANGLFEMRVTGADLTTLGAGVYVYDLIETMPDTTTEVMMKGTFQVLARSV